MDRNDRDIDVAFSKVQAVLKLLETKGDVWELEVQDVPIWWFVRNRFYYQLVKYFNNNKGNQAFTDSKNNSKGISHFFSVCFKGGIFGIRALVGMMRLKRVKQKQSLGRPIMFLSVPGDFRGVEDKERRDIFLDPIYRKISRKSIMVERTTLSKWDLHSLLHRKDVIFFDWFMLLALLKLSLRLLKAPEVKGWHLLRNKCQEINFAGIPSEQLLSMMKSIIDGFSRKAIVQVEASKMLLQEINPGVIIEICSYDSGSMAVNLIARRRRIPVVELQHGVINKGHMGYTYFIPQDRQVEKLIPDRILVFGEAFKQAILATGTAFTSDNIVISGFPRMSTFLEKLEREGRDSLREEIRHRLRINSDTFLITVTTQPMSSRCLASFLREALKTLEINNFTVCIKPHPSEAETWKRSYGDIIQDPRVRTLTNKDIDLYELLVASDVHATVCSTVFLECFALGVPNIIIGCPGYSNVLQLVDQNEIIIVKDPSEFIAQLKRLDEDAEYGEMIVKKGAEASGRFFASDNSPVDAIIKEIEKCRGAQ